MKRIYTSEVKQHIGERVHLAGWLHNLRRLGGINFLVLRDAHGTVQVVVEAPAARAALDGLLPETVLAVEGLVVAEPQAPGGVELREPTFEVLA
ncbi:MAG: OB-fold nucleic acid binding domain-containing protein, partial [Anaerolineae bacterium]